MSHQIKRLSLALLTAGSAGGNFPSTIYAQSSTWGPAATPGPTAKQPAKARALAHHEPNPLSRRAARYYAAVSAVDSRTGKEAEAGEIIPGSWPVLDRDKRRLPNLREAARPPSTRAILIGWILGPPRRVKRGDQVSVIIGQFQATGSSRLPLGIRLAPPEACWGAKKSRSL